MIKAEHTYKIFFIKHNRTDFYHELRDAYMDHYYVSYEKYLELCHALLGRVKGAGKSYSAILCPLRGGFFLSYFMSVHLKLPMSYIEISSYAGREQQRFQIGIRPEFAGGSILLCDDIYDSGNTIKKIHSLYPDVDFDTVCLVSKSADAGVIYGELVDRERWVDFFWEVM